MGAMTLSRTGYDRATPECGPTKNDAAAPSPRGRRAIRGSVTPRRVAALRTMPTLTAVTKHRCCADCDAQHKSAAAMQGFRARHRPRHPLATRVRPIPDFASGASRQRHTRDESYPAKLLMKKYERRNT
jgi:hypothetical protein